MVSSATFPDYFLKDGLGVVSPRELNTELDLTIFAECFARPLGINRCYMGTEPLDMITAAYNRQMKEILPSYGIEVVEIPRLENAGGVLSASRVRRLLDKGNLAAIGELVPPRHTNTLWQTGTENRVKKVSLEEVLAFREKRAHRRQELLSRYPFSLACLGLNIPGEYKDFPWALHCFHEETETFTLALEAGGMIASHEEREEKNSGYTAYISVDAALEDLKVLAFCIEETHPLGRLFDMDIYEPGGGNFSVRIQAPPHVPVLSAGERFCLRAKPRPYAGRVMRFGGGDYGELAQE